MVGKHWVRQQAGNGHTADMPIGIAEWGRTPPGNLLPSIPLLRGKGSRRRSRIAGEAIYNDVSCNAECHATLDNIW